MKLLNCLLKGILHELRWQQYSKEIKGVDAKDSEECVNPLTNFSLFKLNRAEARQGINSSIRWQASARRN